MPIRAKSRRTSFTRPLGARLFLCASALMLTTALARAASDDCGASAQERDAFVTKAMIAQLDTGEGPARHPIWMRADMLEPETQAQRLARYCDANREAKLRAALESLQSPESAGP